MMAAGPSVVTLRSSLGFQRPAGAKMLPVLPSISVPSPGGDSNPRKSNHFGACCHGNPERVFRLRSLWAGGRSLGLSRELSSQYERGAAVRSVGLRVKLQASAPG